MLFQLKLRSQVGASRPLPIKKRRPDLKITLKKLANEPLGARFRALLANWDALLFHACSTSSNLLEFSRLLQILRPIFTQFSSLGGKLSMPAKMFELWNYKNLIFSPMVSDIILIFFMQWVDMFEQLLSFINNILTLTELSGNWSKSLSNFCWV